MADQEIDDLLRDDSPYEIPFADPPPPVIVDISARLSGYRLYEARTVPDTDDQVDNQLLVQYKYAMRIIKELKLGRRRIEATRTSDTTYPEIVAFDDDESGQDSVSIY